MRSWDLQVAVRTKLLAQVSLMALVDEVYDHAPKAAAYPYVVIGEEIAGIADTDTSLGEDDLVTVHTWSRYRGRKEAKQIQQEIYAALHRETLAVTGAAFVDCNLDSEETFLDDDGLTMHGVSRFRVLLDEVQK